MALARRSLLLTTTLLLLLLTFVASGADAADAAAECEDTLLPVARDLCSGLGFNSRPSPDSCGLLSVLESSVDGGLVCDQSLIKPVITVAPNGLPLNLPNPIPDLRPLPHGFRRDPMLRSEATNYYFIFRIVWNLYLWAPCTVLPGFAAAPPPLPVPTGWSLLQTLGLGQPGLPSDAEGLPLMAVMKKGKTLGVFIRGTQTTFEWGIDFTYQHANDTSSNTSAPSPFPGKTHSGFTKIANDLWAGGLRELLDQQMALPLESRPDTVLVGGHSLGAGVGTLLAYMVQDRINKMNASSPAARVDAYLFAAPSVGDKAFALAFNKLVNARRIQFVFDIIPQTPCAPKMIACNDSVVDTTNGGRVRTWAYWPVGGAITLTTQNIPVTRTVWDKLSSLSLCNFQAFQDATHECSYFCALSYFTSESGDSCLLHKAKASELARGTYCVTDTTTFPTANNYP